MSTTRTSHGVDIAELTGSIEARDVDGVNRVVRRGRHVHDHRSRPPAVGAVRPAGRRRDPGVLHRPLRQEHRSPGPRARRHTRPVAFAQHCRYPDGGKVVCVTTAELDQGKIVDQTAVQAWDS